MLGFKSFLVEGIADANSLMSHDSKLRSAGYRRVGSLSHATNGNQVHTYQTGKGKKVQTTHIHVNSGVVRKVESHAGHPDYIKVKKSLDEGVINEGWFFGDRYKRIGNKNATHRVTFHHLPTNSKHTVDVTAPTDRHAESHVHRHVLGGRNGTAPIRIKRIQHLHEETKGDGTHKDHFPATHEHKGLTYYRTGKIGLHVNSGQRTAEYEHETDHAKYRVWRGHKTGETLREDLQEVRTIGGSSYNVEREDAHGNKVDAEVKKLESQGHKIRMVYHIDADSSGGTHNEARITYKHAKHGVDYNKWVRSRMKPGPANHSGNAEKDGPVNESIVSKVHAAIQHGAAKTHLAGLSGPENLSTGPGGMAVPAAYGAAHAVDHLTGGRISGAIDKIRSKFRKEDTMDEGRGRDDDYTLRPLKGNLHKSVKQGWSVHHTKHGRLGTIWQRHDGSEEHEAAGEHGGMSWDSAGPPDKKYGETPKSFVKDAAKHLISNADSGARKPKVFTGSKKNEDLQELSKGTLSSYADKAKTAYDSKYKELSTPSHTGPVWGDMKGRIKKFDDQINKLSRRRKGINRAKAKLGEDLDEALEIKHAINHLDRQARHHARKYKEHQGEMSKITNNPEHSHEQALNYQKHAEDAIWHHGQYKSRLKQLDAGKNEDLQELSKKTLGSYVKKAHASGTEAARDHEQSSNSDRAYDRAYGKRYLATVGKRRKGIDMATDKLTKEDTDLQELSKNTLHSYLARARGNRNAAANRRDVADEKWEKASKAHRDGTAKTAHTGDYQRQTMKIQSSVSKAADRTIEKRTKGIAAARSRLTKEDLDEGLVSKITNAAKNLNKKLTPASERFQKSRDKASYDNAKGKDLSPRGNALRKIERLEWAKKNPVKKPKDMVPMGKLPAKVWENYNDDDNDDMITKNYAAAAKHRDTEKAKFDKDRMKKDDSLDQPMFRKPGSAARKFKTEGLDEAVMSGPMYAAISLAARTRRAKEAEKDHKDSDDEKPLFKKRKQPKDLEVDYTLSKDGTTYTPTVRKGNKKTRKEDLDEGRFASVPKMAKYHAKKKWMSDFEGHVTTKSPEHSGKIDWDTATHLHNKGKTPEEAAHTYYHHVIKSQQQEELEPKSGQKLLKELPKRGADGKLAKSKTAQKVEDCIKMSGKKEKIDTEPTLNNLTTPGVT